MFEAAELGNRIPKSEFERELPELRSRLLAAQRALRRTRHPVIVIVSGVEGAGKSDVVDRLHEWLDARGISTHAFWRSSDEEDERPRWWRFWRRLPPRGTIGVMFGSWYTGPIVDRVYGRLTAAELDRELQRIAFVERMLAQDGALILKLWFHLSQAEQKARIERTTKRSRRGVTLAPTAKKFAKRYDRFLEVSERAIRATDTAEAPWHVIEATNSRYRDLTAAKRLLEALEELVSTERPPRPEPPAPVHANEVSSEPPARTVLEGVDLTRTLDPDSYQRKLVRHQRRLGRLAWKAWDRRRSTVVLFEGWDAAGKGGAIRRLIAPIDARLLQVISVGAPTEDERAQHYLWRFWRRVPRAGTMTIYDRTWYGRVLVERVEGLARIDEWFRAYREINDFEEQLVEHGIVLVKVWLHIDQDEQLRRFEERQRTPWKQHKITDEDWRNRERWDDYLLAVNDMIEHTSTAVAPWHVVAANDKRHARVEVVRTVARSIEQALG